MSKSALGKLTGLERFAAGFSADYRFGPPNVMILLAVCLLAMAVLRSTCHREDLRRPEEAIELAQRACRVTKHPTSDAFMVLASAYATEDKPDLAASAIKRAIQLARADDDVDLVRELQKDLTQFRELVRSQLEP